MNQAQTETPVSTTDLIATPDDLILVTGAAGFIGSRVVASLLRHGFRNIRCFARPSSDVRLIDDIRQSRSDGAKIEIVRGNLLSPDDCVAATKGVVLTYHLAAGRGEKSYPDAFMNSVVTTRNLLDALVGLKTLKRFLNVSSFAVYSNRRKPKRRVLDESCPIEEAPVSRGEAYCYAKVKQDELVNEYATQHNIPCVIVRPGAVYGPGNESITSRVGIGTFGVFLHMGGSNSIPLTHVDNCADAMVLAGAKKGVDGEVFNIVDDDLPSSRQFLRAYKRNVKSFRSIYVPRWFSYMLCLIWEKYSNWSRGQLPPVYNRLHWHANWKGSVYKNDKLKELLGWTQRLPTAAALRSHFEHCKKKAND